jgi:hypothetical protein
LKPDSPLCMESSALQHSANCRIGEFFRLFRNNSPTVALDEKQRC